MLWDSYSSGLGLSISGSTKCSGWWWTSEECFSSSGWAEISEIFESSTGFLLCSDAWIWSDESEWWGSVT